MSQQEWLIWLGKQSALITGPIDAFMQGQRDTYDETARALDEHRIVITSDWVMARITEELVRVRLSEQDPPERDRHRKHQGRLFAYEHMRMQFYCS